MDKFEELVWPSFLKFCDANELIFNHDNLTKNVVKVVDGSVKLRKGIEKDREIWVTLDKEFVKVIYASMVAHRRRITLGELEILFPGVRDVPFIFKVFSKMDNLFRYEFREGRVYLK